jgi:hypothetical protein
MCEEGGADYVKTSSGFNGKQHFYSLMESLRIMKKNAPHLEMKAAGGIDNYKLANNVLAAGVSKIGTSSGHIIMDQLNHVLDNQKPSSVGSFQNCLLQTSRVQSIHNLLLSLRRYLYYHTRIYSDIRV